MTYEGAVKLIDEKQLAEITDRSVRTVQADRQRGIGIPYIRLGRSIRYDLEVVKQYLGDHTIATENGDEQWPAPPARPAAPPRGPSERPHPHPNPPRAAGLTRTRHNTHAKGKPRAPGAAPENLDDGAYSPSDGTAAPPQRR